ncbi:MAG: sigma-70 family RNA polymerase sigma factor [Planctomycetes bacterium]|nr:sigma-70 family RNA polymerase sigma factor [Planctomycetota bacterium]
MTALPDGPPDTKTLELLARLHEDDTAAWGELYGLYRDELLLAIRLNLGERLRSCLESEDVLQSAALEAFRALPRFEYRGKGSLRAYLHRVVLNTIRDRADYFTARRRQRSVPLTDSIADGLATDEPRYRDAPRYERLEKAMTTLPEEMRTVIVLRRIHGLSSKEAAERMGRSDDATRKLYSRAMARLAMALGA